ncbi:hypothetical protein HK098_001422 [Nowakowskiella sp. JEL0407]|nr:hypothetical protein HK098_001422 [Nowakowskiella sp. JEL0407]
MSTENCSNNLIELLGVSLGYDFTVALRNNNACEAMFNSLSFYKCNEKKEIVYLDLSRFYGINYSKLPLFKNLIELRIIKSKLTTFPPEILSLVNLRILNLRDNSLTSVPDLSAFQQLQFLDLSGNKLTTFPETVFDCTELKLLDLCDNSIRGTLPDKWSKLSSIARGSVSIILLKVFLDLSVSRYSFLTGNEISGLIPLSLGSLTHLRGISFRSPEACGAIFFSSDKLQHCDIGFRSLCRVNSSTENNVCGIIPTCTDVNYRECNGLEAYLVAYYGGSSGSYLPISNSPSSQSPPPASPPVANLPSSKRLPNSSPTQTQNLPQISTPLVLPSASSPAHISPSIVNSPIYSTHTGRGSIGVAKSSNFEDVSSIPYTTTSLLTTATVLDGTPVVMVYENNNWRILNAMQESVTPIAKSMSDPTATIANIAGGLAFGLFLLISVVVSIVYWNIKRRRENERYSVISEDLKYQDEDEPLMGKRVSYQTNTSGGGSITSYSDGSNQRYSGGPVEVRKSFSGAGNRFSGLFSRRSSGNSAQLTQLTQEELRKRESMRLLDDDLFGMKMEDEETVQTNQSGHSSSSDHRHHAITHTDIIIEEEEMYTLDSRMHTIRRTEDGTNPFGEQAEAAYAKADPFGDGDTIDRPNVEYLNVGKGQVVSSTSNTLAETDAISFSTGWESRVSLTEGLQQAASEGKNPVENPFGDEDGTIERPKFEYANVGGNVKLITHDEAEVASFSTGWESRVSLLDGMDHASVNVIEEDHKSGALKISGTYGGQETSVSSIQMGSSQLSSAAYGGKETALTTTTVQSGATQSLAATASGSKVTASHDSITNDSVTAVNEVKQSGGASSVQQNVVTQQKTEMQGGKKVVTKITTTTTTTTQLVNVATAAVAVQPSAATTTTKIVKTITGGGEVIEVDDFAVDLNAVGRVFSVKFPHAAGIDDELDLVEGDIVTVDQIFPDGWCFGWSHKSGHVGVFPYFVLLPCRTHPEIVYDAPTSESRGPLNAITLATMLELVPLKQDYQAYPGQRDEMDCSVGDQVTIEYIYKDGYGLVYNWSKRKRGVIQTRVLEYTVVESGEFTRYSNEKRRENSAMPQTPDTATTMEFQTLTLRTFSRKK